MAINFKKEDFEQLDYKYIMINQTSGTEYRNYNHIWIENFSDNGMTIVLPKASCNLGHNLMLMFLKGRKPRIPAKLSTDGMGKGIIYSLMGKVKTKRDKENNTNLSIVELQFSQFDKDGWNRFIGKYEEKQEDITQTLEHIKAYEE